MSTKKCRCGEEIPENQFECYWCWKKKDYNKDFSYRKDFASDPVNSSGNNKTNRLDDEVLEENTELFEKILREEQRK